MSILKQKVESKVFGIGEISWYGKKDNGNSYIKVDFAGKSVQFSFPSCFENHLKALGEELKVEISNEMKRKVAAPINQKIEDDFENERNYISTTKIKNAVEPLKIHYLYGTNAQNIYIRLCDRFGWDISQKGKFAIMQLLYAEKATKEGYSPWFVAHSNYTETDNGKWKNEFVGEYIREEWEHPDERLYTDKTTRVVFAKKNINGRKEYVFHGVYKVERIEVPEKTKSSYVKVYKRISETYPFEL